MIKKACRNGCRPPENAASPVGKFFAGKSCILFLKVCGLNHHFCFLCAREEPEGAADHKLEALRAVLGLVPVGPARCTVQP